MNANKKIANIQLKEIRSASMCPSCNNVLLYNVLLYKPNAEQLIVNTVAKTHEVRSICSVEYHKAVHKKRTVLPKYKAITKTNHSIISRHK